MKRAFLASDGRLRSGWRFLLALVVFVLANLLGALLAVSLADERTHLFQVLYRGGILLFLIVAYVWMSRHFDRVHHRPLAYIGLPGDVPWLRQTIVGFLYGAALVSLAVAVIAAVGDVTFSLQLSTATFTVALIQFVMFALAGMLEEVAFRGYPFHRLVEGAGAVAAIIIANVLFGALHLGNPDFSGFAMFNTFLVGVPFAIAYLLTRALWLPWGFHWGWNFALGVLYGLPVSGGHFAAPVRGTASGPPWLTGGGYGIEGGASGTIAILVGLAGIFWLARSEALVGRPPEPVFPGNNPPVAGIQP